MGDEEPSGYARLPILREAQAALPSTRVWHPVGPDILSVRVCRRV